MLRISDGLADGDIGDSGDANDLAGVRFFDFGAVTQSLVVRSLSGTVRTIETIHRHDKFQEFQTAGF